MIRYNIVYNIREAVDLYDSGHSLRAISEIFGVSRKFIRKSIANVRNIRSAKEQSFLTAQMRNMSDWFDIIDSHLKAYWLGFVLADGNVASNLRSVEIDLAIKDVEHLNKFAEIFRIDVEKGENRCRCRICNVYLCNILDNIGIHPNKTYLNDASVFDKIPLKFANSFILGFMDGDGSIYLDNRKNNYIILDFTGSESILRNVRDILVSILRVNKNKVSPTKSVFRIQWSGKQAIKILNWLYKDSPVRLERKFNIYNNIASEKLFGY